MTYAQPHCTIMHSRDPNYTDLVILLTSKELKSYIHEIEHFAF